MVRVDALSYSPEGVVEETDISVGRCREIIEKQPVTWINIVDIDARTRQELETLFALHPLALEDASRMDIPPKVEQYDDVLFIVARTIVWEEAIETDQLSLFLSKRFVVTIHDKIFPQLEDIRVRIRRRDPKLLKSGSDYVFYMILDTLVDSYFPNLDRLDDIIEGLEEGMIRDPNILSIDKIHSVRTDLVKLRNALRPQRDSFAQLMRLDLPFFKKDTRNYLRDLYDHMILSLDRLDTQREIVTSLMEVQTALVSNSVNRVIKVLTIIFTVTLPLALLTSAFGMNVDYPGRDKPLGFAMSLILMIGTTAAMAWYLKRKRMF